MKFNFFSKDKPQIKSESQLKLSDIEQLSDLFGIDTSSTGINVTPDSAMRSSAVYRCVTLIASGIGGLSLEIFKTNGEIGQVDKKHKLYPILHKEPNPLMTAIVYWETTVAQMLLNGNSYGLIARNHHGDPQGISLIPPKKVSQKFKAGRMQYTIAVDDSSYAVYDQDDILHFPGFGWDGEKGKSAVSYAAKEAIGVSLAAEKYSGTFFKNGARPDGVLQFPNKLDKEQAELIRDYWSKKHQGLGNTHLPAVLTEGGEYQQVSMNAEDSQLIESRSFQISDIARIFGVPPHMIGLTEKSTSWGSGIEQQSIAFVMYTLRPHMKRMEQEMNRKLFSKGDFEVKFNISALLRADIKARNESYRIARGGNQEPGHMTINEIRARENLPPIEGADELYKPLTGEKNNEK